MTEIQEAKCHVELIDWPMDLERIIHTAIRTCYSSEEPEDLYGESFINPSFINHRLIEEVINSGHSSVLEHTLFVFTISGVSRILTHQLITHRFLSKSQKSQRYVGYHTPPKFIIPPSISSQGGEVLRLYEESLSNSYITYAKLKELGIPGEDARYVFPNATSSALVVSCNLRELMHIANVRLCKRAQWETRNLVGEMVQLVIDKDSWVAQYLVPKCIKEKECRERKGCGFYKTYLQSF